MTEPEIPRAPFDEVTSVTMSSPGRFTADVHPGWSIAGKPNGGYLLAILGRAAAAVSSHPHPVATSAHYLRSPEFGPVTIETEVLREGRSASQLRARLMQAGRPCVEALITMGDLAAADAHWARGLPSPEHHAYDDCVPLARGSREWAGVTILDQIHLRLDPDVLGFAEGRPSGNGELRGWLTLPDHDALDPVSLLFAVDSFPPATFDVELTGWVPTIELTAYVRAIPAPGPVRILQRAQLIGNQRVDQACFVWDCTGALVAQATQLAGVRLGR